MISIQKSLSLKQIVYISNRPNELAETIKHVRFYMKFIKDIVIYCPDYQIIDFIALCPGCRIFDENELLGEKINEFRELKLNSLDKHDRINYLLRSCLSSAKEVDSVFIMSDDDYRPLKNIDASFFYDASRKIYNAYFMTSLEFYIGFIEQRRDPNRRNFAFHNAQYDMMKLFGKLGLPRLMYASHMPQVVDKSIFRESVEFFEKNSEGYSIDEWSSYFNFGSRFYPNRFNICLYETMCWPHQNFGLSIPNELSFELIYQEDVIKSPYSAGRIFANIPEAFTPYQDRVNSEKIKRYNDKIKQYYSGVKNYTGKDMQCNNSSIFKGNVINCSGKTGDCVVYGPYARIPRGKYNVNVQFKMTHVVDLPYFCFDICANGGEIILMNKEIVSIENSIINKNGIFESNFEFENDTLLSDVEFRIFISDAENSFQLISININSTD